MRTAAGYVGTRITNDWNVKVEEKGGPGGEEGRGKGSPRRPIPHHKATHWPLKLGEGAAKLHYDTMQSISDCCPPLQPPPTRGNTSSVEERICASDDNSGDIDNNNSNDNNK